METPAATLKKKKPTKGKLKKTMKNLLCRPDPVFWPELSEKQSKELEIVLQKFKVKVVVFKKPHWSEIKALPKDKRPKAPTLEKVEGILFGISVCGRTIPNGTIGGVVIDSEVSPRILVQHILEACTTTNIPVVCLKDLKKTCSSNFGFPACCIGVQKNCDSVSELLGKVVELAGSFKTPKTELSKMEVDDTKCEVNDTKCEVNDTKCEVKTVTRAEESIPFTYLYRNSKKTRVFVPPSGITTIKSKGFIGQDFIDLPGISEKAVKDTLSRSKSYMNMTVKRFTNNPNRKNKNNKK